MERRAVGAGWWARVKGVVLARMVKGERVEGDGRGGVRGGEGGVFLLAWVVPAWVVFELSMAKLPHYTLPMYPALALLGARVVMRRAQGGVRARWGEWVPWAVVSVGVGVAMVVGARAGGWRVEEWRWGVVAGLVVAGAGVVLGGRAQRGAWGGFGAAGVGMGMVATMGVCGLVLPRQNELSAEVARQVRVVSWEGARPVGLVTYRPNSLVFELRGKVERVRAGEAEVWLKGRPRGVLVYLDGEERWDWGKGTGKVERQVAGWGVLAGVAWGRNVGEGLVGREERRVVLIEGRR
jgi:4-amino-4-deoxy-L-arabinose transferase-like glycosyltransferase